MQKFRRAVACTVPVMGHGVFVFVWTDAKAKVRVSGYACGCAFEEREASKRACVR